MIRVASIADIHLQDGFESKEAKALFQSVEIFKNESVDIVSIPGDIFEDASTPEQRLVFRKFLDSIEVPILILRGNHDKPKELLLYENRSKGIFVSEKPEILEIKTPGGSIQFLTIPHFSAGALALQSQSVEQLGEKGTNAFMDILDSYFQKIHNSKIPSFVPFHGTISGAKLDNEKIPRMNGIHLPLGLLESFGCPVVGGHYHKLQNVGGKVWYPGSITRQTWGEAKDDKGILIWTWDRTWDDEPVFHSLNPEKMISVTAKWTGEKFIDQSGSQIDISSLSDTNSKLRFRYTVDKELVHTLPSDLKETLKKIDPDVKIERTTDTKIAVRNSEIAKVYSIEEALRVYFESKGMGNDEVESHLAERKRLLDDAVNQNNEEVLV